MEVYITEIRRVVNYSKSAQQTYSTWLVRLFNLLNRHVRNTNRTCVGKYCDSVLVLSTGRNYCARRPAALALMVMLICLYWWISGYTDLCCAACMNHNAAFLIYYHFFSACDLEQSFNSVYKMQVKCLYDYTVVATSHWATNYHINHTTKKDQSRLSDLFTCTQIELAENEDSNTRRNDELIIQKTRYDLWRYTILNTCLLRLRIVDIYGIVY